MGVEDGSQTLEEVVHAGLIERCRFGLVAGHLATSQVSRQQNLQVIRLFGRIALRRLRARLARRSSGIRFSSRGLSGSVGEGGHHAQLHVVDVVAVGQPLARVVGV
jgi:hypothetical protein